MINTYRLFYAMQRKDMSIADLSRKVGICYSYANNICNGRQACSIKVLKKIAKVLGCTLDYLTTETTEEEMKNIGKE